MWGLVSACRQLPKTPFRGPRRIAGGKGCSRQETLSECRVIRPELLSILSKPVPRKLRGASQIGHPAPFDQVGSLGQGFDNGLHVALLHVICERVPLADTV